MKPLVAPRPRFVYFARCGDYVKVGCTADVVARVKALNTASGRAALACPDDLPNEPLTLIGVAKGGFDAEFTAHAALYPWSVVGEWFRVHPDLLARIATWSTEPLPEPRVKRRKAKPAKPEKPARMTTNAERGTHLAAEAPPLTDAQVEQAARLLAAEPEQEAAA